MVSSCVDSVGSLIFVFIDTPSKFFFHAIDIGNLGHPLSHSPYIELLMVASNPSVPETAAGFGPGDTFDKRFKLQVWELVEPGAVVETWPELSPFME